MNIQQTRPFGPGPLTPQEAADLDEMARTVAALSQITFVPPIVGVVDRSGVLIGANFPPPPPAYVLIHAGAGPYTGYLTTTDDGGATWTDGTSIVNVAGPNGEALTVGKRYRADLTDYAGDGTPEYVAAADAVADVGLYDPAVGDVSGLVGNDVTGAAQYLPGPKIFTNSVQINGTAQFPLAANDFIDLVCGTAGSSGRAYFYGADFAFSTGAATGAAGVGSNTTLDTDKTKPTQLNFELIGSHLDGGVEYGLFSLMAVDPTVGSPRTIKPAFRVGTLIGRYGTDSVGNVFTGGVCTTVGSTTFVTGGSGGTTGLTLTGTTTLTIGGTLVAGNGGTGLATSGGTAGLALVADGSGGWTTAAVSSPGDADGVVAAQVFGN